MDDTFPDENEHLMDQLCEKYPSMATLEMETFHLYVSLLAHTEYCICFCGSGATILSTTVFYTCM